MIKGTVKTRFNSDYYEYKVSGIELLSEVRETYVKSITVNLPLSKLNEHVVKAIENLVAENKGKALLKFNVYDPENNMHIEMFSRTARIHPSDKFLSFFDGQPDISYRIN